MATAQIKENQKLNWNVKNDISENAFFSILSSETESAGIK